MYNIISNNCVGGRYYELINKQFPNPFIWNSIKLSDFRKLIENFDNLNLSNISFTFTENEFNKGYDISNNINEIQFNLCTTAIINNNINLYFIHHHYANNEYILTLHGTSNVKYGKNILQYCYECYNRRLTRFNKSNIIFVYCDYKEYTNIDITNLFNINTKYNIIIISNDDYTKYNNTNIHCITYKGDMHNTCEIAKLLYTYLAQNKLEINALGRLGNIMFEYASCYYNAIKYNKLPYLNLYNAYPNEEIIKYVNTFVNFKGILTENVKITNNINVENHSHEYKEIKETDKFITGYRQSPKYWDNNKEFVKHLYSIPNDLYTYINELYNLDFNNIVSIHIRRCDYLTANNTIVLPLEYIYKCINLYNTKQKFIIISDDLYWCKKNLIGNQFIFADKISIKYPQELVDMYLMTLCKDNIISNSSFSWWGAYLNVHKERKVYYHMPWAKNDIYTDIIPENDNWIEIK